MTNTLHEYLCTYISLSSSQNEKCFRLKLQRKSEHILCSVTLPRKSCHLWNNVEKHGTVGQTTDDNTIRLMHFACWIKGCRHTLRIWNIYCFTKAAMLAQARLGVTLYVHCLSCETLLTIKMDSELRCMLPIETHDSWRGYKARQMILGKAVLKQPSLRLLPSHCYPLFAASSSDQNFTVHYEVTPLLLNILKHVPLYPKEFLKFWLKITVNCNNLFLSAKENPSCLPQCILSTYSLSMLR
jgi:hypothetical protein